MKTSLISCPDNNSNDKRFQTNYFRATRNSVIHVSLPAPTVDDDRLEDEDIGFLMRIFANADTWKVIPKYIAKQKNRGGINKIYAQINKLIGCGYAVRMVHRAKNSNGRFSSDQYIGYNFFTTPASAQDIEEAKEKFKESFRNPSYREHGHREHANGGIEQHKEETLTKDTTPTPIVDKSGVGSKEPRLLPSSKKRKKKKEPEIDQSSLTYFDSDRNYLKGKSESEIRALYLHFQKKRHSIKEPVAYLTACARKGWHLQEDKNDEYLVENYKLAKQMENNFFRLGFNGDYTYFNANSDGMVFMKSGKEIPLPGYEMKCSRFKEYMEEIFITNSNYSKEIFV